MPVVQNIRHTLGNKRIYDLRKETIERIFGTAKEQHGFRYTQYIGKARMEMKAGLTFACMNLKKLVRILAKREEKTSTIHNIWRLLKEKTLLKKVVLEIISSTNFVYSLWGMPKHPPVCSIQRAGDDR